MAKKVKLEAEIGANTKPFDDAIDKTGDKLDDFGKSSALSIAGVTTAALAAAGVMLNWAKQTEWGLAAMNKGLAKTKQLLQEIMTGSNSRDNIKEAGRIADAMSQSEAQRTRNEYLATKMSSEIKSLQVQAASTKFLTEKKDLLNKAMEKEAELKSFLLKQAGEEVKNAYDLWAINLGNVDAKNKYYEAAKRFEEIKGMDSRLLAGQVAEIQKQEIERTLALADAFTEVGDSIEELKKKYGPFWAEIEQLQKLPQNNQPKSVFEAKTFGLSKVTPKELQKYSGTADQEKANMMADAVQDLSSGLTESQTALLELSDMFSGFFTNVDDGFQGMIDGVIKGIERLVVELLAKAAILAILSAITGVPMPALNTILPSGVNTLMGGSVGSTSSSGLAMNSAPMGGGKMTSEISGKKLKFLIDNRS